MVNIEQLLTIANEYKASDVHITVGVPPKMRVNGALLSMDFPMLLPADTEEIIKPTMDARQLEVLANKGEADYSFSISGLGRYRVNAYYQRGALAAAFRLISNDIPKPDQLGLPQSMVDLYAKRRGLIIVTGPTGSGKSTSLAALIDKINESRTDHIITLEDPIEYLHSHKKSVVNQREIGLDTQSYANSLRAALREDPDVILVGEMRDLETISTAITAAETGHLVLSTLHTIGASSTIDRIIDVFPPHQQQQVRVQLSMVLQAVISQQLMPTADGKGRVAAFEVMLMSTAIKNLIRDNKTFQIDALIQTSRQVGMITMDDAIYDLYMKKKITREIALSYAQDPAALQKKLGVY